MTTTVQLRWTWDPTTLAALVDAGYDQQKIEVDSGTGWVEATRATTRLPLFALVERYLWELGSEETYDFRVVPYRTSDQVDGIPLSITDVAARGYATIADMRGEGYNDPPYDDARVRYAIDLAMHMIDRICGQRFDAYYARRVLDIPKPYDEVHLDEPIAALWQLVDADGAFDLSQNAILVSNRHLTQGMEHPDDRKDPRLAWSDDGGPRVRVLYPGLFLRGRRGLTVVGVWGFTALGSADEVGEQPAESQQPLSYGSTPADIRIACMKLAGRYLPLLASKTTDEAAIASRVISERTRDQSYALSGTEGTFVGPTGDITVDDILVRHMAPISLGSV